MNEPDLESLYTVLAFDPGGTTGWAVIAVYDGVIGPPPFETWIVDYSKDLWTRANGMEAGLKAIGWHKDSPSDPGWAEAQLVYKAEVAEARNYKILDNVAFWSAGQFSGDRGDQVDAMIELTLAWPNTCPVVHEGFTLRQFRMDPMLLEPVRITERYRQDLRDLGPYGRLWRPAEARRAGSATPVGRKRDVIQQPASLAKTTITDERLRRTPSGFFNATAGKEHARDAVRHALTFLRREKEARSFGRTLHVC